MPEGHAIHRLARAHSRLLTGQVVAASSPQGRFSAGAARVDGRTVEAVDARGKHLLYRFAGIAEQLHVHLGLAGRFETGPAPPPAAAGPVRLRLVTGEHWLDLRGPAACELLTPDGVDRLVARLGPDPLRADARPESAYQRIGASRAPLAALLLDQRVIAGAGNIFRVEVLFRQRVAPTRPGTALDRPTWEALWDDLVRLMRAGVRTGRIVTTRPEHRDHPRGTPSRADSFYVYQRTGLPCRLCGTPIRTGVLGARNAFWCPRCQAS